MTDGFTGANTLGLGAQGSSADWKVPPRAARPFIMGAMDLHRIIKSGKIAASGELRILDAEGHGLDCAAFKNRSAWTTQFNLSPLLQDYVKAYSKQDYVAKHNSQPYGNNATRKIETNEVLTHNILHCRTLWHLLWQHVDDKANAADKLLCRPVEGSKLAATMAVLKDSGKSG